jgi:diadenosine tetraphosphate (Ap4A) HIT family hydrolase
MKHRSCEFCLEIATGRVSGEYFSVTRVKSRILLATLSTVAIPTLSPLRQNHLLVIPRRHVTASVQLAEKEQYDLDLCVSLVRKKLFVSPDDGFLVFEHGIGAGQAGGCGVSHCHVHVMPVACGEARNITAVFESALRLKSGEENPELTTSSSYINVEVYDGESIKRFSRVGDFPSQYARNLVEEALDLPRTSWRQLLRSELIQATLRDTRWAT